MPIRGLQYHCRIWGDPAAPKVFLLHGAQDVSASWQFTVDEMKQDWHFIAPDWRGYGMTSWGGGQSYYQQDLVGDLHKLLAHYSSDEPAVLMTHSLGGNVSAVYADPCAQHVLGMMLALGRQLLPSYRDQLTDHAWRIVERRGASRLLTGQTVLLLGFGAIGRRLAELLAPFGVKIYAVRRQTRSEPGVRIVPEEDLTRVLPLADHVVNILSENDSTRNYVNARRLGWFKPGARFYNVGRGATMDQRAVLEALQSGRLGAAYLDVFEPEPLPPNDPLWTAPNCYITPHTAGGRHDQNEAVVKHFLSNLDAFQRGAALVDRIV